MHRKTPTQIPAQNTQPRRLIRRPAVMARTGLTKTTIWRHERAGDFPKSVRLTDATVAWVEDEIDAWIAVRIGARDAKYGSTDTTSLSNVSAPIQARDATVPPPPPVIWQPPVWPVRKPGRPKLETTVVE